MVLRAGGRHRPGGGKVYIEHLHVTQLRLTLSFVPSPGTAQCNLCLPEPIHGIWLLCIARMPCIYQLEQVIYTVPG